MRLSSLTPSNLFAPIGKYKRSLLQRTLMATCCAAVTISTSGCTSLSDYVHNGWKVGPNYRSPRAPVAPAWIDATDQRVHQDTPTLSHWWTVFNDAALNKLVCDAYRQNLTLRQAGYQILAARAQRNVTAGNLFPQTQAATGDFTRNAISKRSANRSFVGTRFYDQFDAGFNLSWELDFWGRYRRAIESAEASLDASVQNYDDVLVTLVSDTATAYVEIRTLETQIRLTEANAALQRKTLEIATARFQGGSTTELDRDQAQSNLSQVEAQIPALRIQLRQANNLLATLMGMPPTDLIPQLGPADIPTAPLDVAVGIPADLLRRRPDVRRAERQAAAQSAQIGIAQSDFYPHIAINGNIGYSSEKGTNLFSPGALDGSVGPAYQWNIFNYGRIRNNVVAQQAQFQALVTAYRNTVLTAAQEVENGLVSFLESQQQTESLTQGVRAAESAAKVVLAQYQGGTVDFNRVVLVQQNLVTQQNLLAQARGNIALGLIEVYRALGGGWEIRCSGVCRPVEMPPESIVEIEDSEIVSPTQAVPAEISGETSADQEPLPAAE